MDVLVIVVVALAVAGVALALRARGGAARGGSGPAAPTAEPTATAFDLAPLDEPYRSRIGRLVQGTPPTDENLALLERAYRAAREATALLAHERRAQARPGELGGAAHDEARRMREHRHELEREIDVVELELQRLTRLAQGAERE